MKHRLLGDGPTPDLVTISTGGANRGEILQHQIQLLQLWNRQDPTQVNEQDVAQLAPWIRTLRLGTSGLLVTYGELNALPDYLPDPLALDTLPASILLPILQAIRRRGFNQLTKLLTGNDPARAFPCGAGCMPIRPWRNGTINSYFETTALNQLTFRLRPAGITTTRGCWPATPVTLPPTPGIAGRVPT